MTTNSANQSSTSQDTELPAAEFRPLSRPALLALLLAVVAALLAPIWTVKFPLLVDYPNHLASAFVLKHLHDAAYHFGEYYRSDWNLYPYLSMDVILLGLQHVARVTTAGRLFLSLCALSVPAATWFFLRRANRGEESLALWSLLVCHNLYFFRFGFLNLQLSMALCFFLLGLWLWHLEQPRILTWAVLLFVTTVLYFTHIMGFAIAAVVMTAYAWGAKLRRKDVLSAWALYVPGAMFYLHAVVGRGSHGGIQFGHFTAKLGNLISVMISWSPILDLLTIVALLAVLGWAQIDNREFHWNRPWRRATLILFLFYWILPGVIGPATNVDKRILPFVFVLGLAAARVGSRGRKIAVAALLLFFVRTAALERSFVALQPHFARLAEAADVVPQNARVLPLVDWAGGASWPERHFWAYGVIWHGWLTPCLFHDPGVHPFALKDDPYDPCLVNMTPTTQLDWPRIAREFDYVWLYHLPQFTPHLTPPGKIVFSGDDLQIVQMKEGAGTGSAGEAHRAPWSAGRVE